MIPEARLQEIESAWEREEFYPRQDVADLVAEVRRLRRLLMEGNGYSEEELAESLAALTEESEDIHDSMWRASQEGRR